MHKRDQTVTLRDFFAKPAARPLGFLPYIGRGVSALKRVEVQRASPGAIGAHGHGPTTNRTVSASPILLYGADQSRPKHTEASTGGRPPGDITLFVLISMKT